MKNRLQTLLVLLISISIFAGFAPATFAQVDDNDCVTKMKPYITEKSTEMRTYLNEHFKSKKTNSSLLDLALKRFDVYKKDLYKKYEEYNPQAGFELLGASAQTLKCSKLVTNEIDLMNKQVRSFFEQTSNVKTTSAVMEKLKAINKKMDTLMRAVMQMYGKWVALKGRIPCFVKECI